MPRGTRESDDAEFLEGCATYSLVPCRAGARLFVLVPGVSRLQSGQVYLTPDQWLELLHSDRDAQGRERLRVMRSLTDPRFFSVSFTSAGRSDWRAQRRYRELMGQH